jgi:hypothetical protein
LDKNKDKMYEHLEALLVSSKTVRFKEMMIQAGADILPTSGAGAGAGAGGGGARSSGKHQRQLDTLASRFTGQLHQLITVLQESEPHFVRCIKPNNLKNPITFEPELVLRQLRYSGVLEAIQIRKSGYPTRKLLSDFFKSYRLLAEIPLASLHAMASDSDRCHAMIESLQKKNSLYLEIKLGKTMVFYRPDVHNLLEHDKIQVGLHAILALQSFYRRHQAIEKVQILWEARRNLRIAMTAGSENQSSNIDALSDLEYWLHYCQHEVRLDCYDVRDGEMLRRRLHEVKLCLEQLEYLLVHGATPMVSHGDITVEYTALEEAIQQAEQLQIIHFIYDQVRSRRDELRGRASAVLSLRKAVKTLDEVALEACLENIQNLILEYGNFCEVEMRDAMELLRRVKLEISVMSEIYSSLSDSQQLLLIAIEQEFGDASFSTSAPPAASPQATKEILSSSLATLTQLLSPIVPPLTSPPSEKIFHLIHLIQRIRSNWLSNDWQQIVDSVIELTEAVQTIWSSSAPAAAVAATTHGGEGEGEGDCQVNSEALQNFSELFSRVVENETRLVAQGVDVHVVLPMLNDGILKGRIQFSHQQQQQSHPGGDDVSQITVDVKSLATAVDKVRKIKTLGPKAKALLLLVESLLSCRNAAADDNFEMVLALTESSPVTSCRHMRQQKLFSFLQRTFEKKKLHKQSSIGFTLESLDVHEDDDDEEEGGKEGQREELHKPLSNFPITDLSLLDDGERLFETMLMERARLLSGPFLSHLSLMQEEIQHARLNSLDKYCQVPYPLFPPLSVPHSLSFTFLTAAVVCPHERFGDPSYPQRGEWLDTTSLGLCTSLHSPHELSFRILSSHKQSNLPWMK